MASSKNMIKFVNDIPHTAKVAMAQILDPPGPMNWETLAGLMGFPSEKVRVFHLALRRNSSPFKDMLTVWGYKNHTVSELFQLFQKMEHVRCMEILKPYVDQHYQEMIPSHNEAAASSFSKDSNFSGGDGSDSSLCQLQHQDSIQYSDRPFVDRRGINPDDLPMPVPPPLECTCGHCLLEEPLLTSVPPSSCRLPLSSSTTSRPGHKSSQSSPLPTNIDSVNIDSKSGKHQHTSKSSSSSSSSAGVSTTSCNLSTGALTESRTKVVELEDYLSEPSIDSELLETLQLHDMKETKEMTPQEKKKRMQMYALAAMNHKKYKEIVSGTDDFNPNNLLGEGAFGKVYRAILNETPFAVKRLVQADPMDLEAEKRDKIARKYHFNEIVALLKYRHTNIVPLCFYSLDGPEPCLVYEFMHNGSLQDKLIAKRQRTSLQWRERMKIAMGSARGIQFLHNAMDKPLIHGDIKSANILLDKHNEPKIGDFGLAREGPKDCKSYTILKTEAVHGTVVYLPPEFLRSWKLSTKVDSYSYGVVLYEILKGQLAFERSKEQPDKLLMQLVESLEDKDDQTIVQTLRDPRCSNWPHEIVVDFISIARKCTADKPKARPEVKEVFDDLVRLDLKVQIMRDNQLGKQPVQNTEPYEVQPVTEGRIEGPPANRDAGMSPAVPPRVPLTDAPARVPSEQSEEPGHREYDESPETESPRQQELVESPAPEMTLEEKAAIKLREIEGEAAGPGAVEAAEEPVPYEVATSEQTEVEGRLTPADLQRLAELKLAAEAPGEEAKIEAVIVDKKGAETSPQDSGRYSDAASDRASEDGHRTASEGYASAATDDTQNTSLPTEYEVGPHSPVQRPVEVLQTYQSDIHRHQGCQGRSSPDAPVPLHRFPTKSPEPCESTDYILTTTQGDKGPTETTENHHRIYQDRLVRMPQDTPEAYPQTPQGYHLQDYPREQVRYQQSHQSPPVVGAPRYQTTPTTPTQNYHQHPLASSNLPMHSPSGYPPPGQPVHMLYSPPGYMGPGQPIQGPLQYHQPMSPHYYDPYVEERMQGSPRYMPQYNPHFPNGGRDYDYGHPPVIWHDDNQRIPAESPCDYYGPYGEAFIDDPLPGERPFRYYPPSTHPHPNQWDQGQNFHQGQQQGFAQARYQRQLSEVDDRKPRRKRYTPDKPVNGMPDTKVQQDRTVTGSPRGNVSPGLRESPQRSVPPALPQDAYRQHVMPQQQQQQRDLQQRAFQSPAAAVHGYPPPAPGMAPGAFQGPDPRDSYNPQYGRMDAYHDVHPGNPGLAAGQGSSSGQGVYYTQRQVLNEDPMQQSNRDQLHGDPQRRLILGRSAEISHC